MKKLALAVAVGLSISTASIATASADLPVVPVSEIADAPSVQVHSSPSSVAKAKAVAKADDAIEIQKLVVKPRVNQVIPISTGHPNRFTTPFNNPKIRTTSDASFDVLGRDVYVASSNEGRPITAFLYDGSNPAVTLSVTFVPRRIPPVDMELEMDTSEFPAGANPLVDTKRAKAWEEKDPYVTTIRNLLRDVAGGETPRGYSLSETPFAGGTPDCLQGGLHFNFIDGQTLDGHRLRVSIGTVENVSSQIIEFREPSCAGADVRAVAAWPKPLLAPGEKSEVYVVRSIEEPHRVRTGSRPSLIK
jgi:conjugal transfer pilus assembly protein TraK